ncbi:MAG: LytTR family DNA-binding domain-containing protein [Clostridia bacterium]|nr:LytTR family DNA-binding domain-containing protein [Clostridia bacterium]
MLNFVICDDNPSILNKLYKMLESIFINNNINAEIGLQAHTAHDVINYVQTHKVDVLILDINLQSEMTGCDIANIVRKKNKDVYIIFTTGHLEYALIAYKYKTFDYLPKPIVNEKLEETILRLIEDIKHTPSKFIRLNNNKTIINQDEVNYIKKDGMKLIFCTTTRTYETYSSFNKIESCLPENFVRCHKSYIINVKKISDINYNKNTVSFSPNDFCSIGSKYKNKILEVFENGNFTNNLERTNNRK